MTGSSGKDDPPGRRPTRRLTGEDKELWRFVTRSVTPMPGRRRGPPGDDDQADHSPHPAAQPAAKPAPHPAPQSRARSARPAPPAPSPKPHHIENAQAPATIDRRKARRIARGRQPIEARIDLHGMRQSEAHTALRGFLMRCYGQGFRHVLVITGKGSARDETEPWSAGERRRGVLRHNVPRWLAEPDLATIVVATAPAHIRHGGDGALYVTLRSSRRVDFE